MQQKLRARQASVSRANNFWLFAVIVCIDCMLACIHADTEWSGVVYRLCYDCSIRCNSACLAKATTDDLEGPHFSNLLHCNAGMLNDAIDFVFLRLFSRLLTRFIESFALVLFIRLVQVYGSWMQRAVSMTQLDYNEDDLMFPYMSLIIYELDDIVGGFRDNGDGCSCGTVF